MSYFTLNVLKWVMMSDGKPLNTFKTGNLTVFNTTKLFRWSFILSLIGYMNDILLVLVYEKKDLLFFFENFNVLQQD